MMEHQVSMSSTIIHSLLFPKSTTVISDICKSIFFIVGSSKSYIRHLKTDARQPIVEKTGVFEVSYDLTLHAVGMKPPPRRDE